MLTYHQQQETITRLNAGKDTQGEIARSPLDDFEARLMSIDPNTWFDALKEAITTAGIYKLALAAVCGLYWFAASKQIIPSAENWEIRIAAAGFILFGLLWIANVFAAALQFFFTRALVASLDYAAPGASARSRLYS